MKNVSEKVALIDLQVIALLTSFAYGYGGFMQKELIIYGATSTDINAYSALVILGWGIPSTQITIALVLSAYLCYVKGETFWWIILVLIVAVLCMVGFLIIMPSVLYPTIF